MLSINTHFIRKATPTTEVGKKEKIWLFTCWEMDLRSCFLHQAVGLSRGACSCKWCMISKSKRNQPSGLVSKYLWCFCVPCSESLFYRDAVGFFFNLLIVFDKHCFCLWAPMFSSQEGPISSSNLISSCHIPKHLDQLPPRWPLLHLANTYLLEMHTVLFWKYEKMLDSPVLWTAYSIS